MLKLLNETSRLSAAGVRGSIAGVWPGTAVCVLIALAASFVAKQHGGPSLLYALLFGLSVNFLGGHPAVTAGIALCGRTALRLGVALLGARITVDQIAGIGLVPAVVVAMSLAGTIALGLLLARVLGASRDHGLVSGCSVGICGASAALAVSAVLPPSEDNDRFTLLTVVGVTVMSTAAMIVYPMALQFLHLPDHLAGIILGGTIHDVAQVVAAGAILGPVAADAAVITKLWRVALLAPVVLLTTLAVRGQPRGSGGRVPLLPPFMVGFVALVAAGSFGLIAQPWVDLANSSSRWLLLVAIAAAGVKTRFQDLARLGWRPLVMLVAETLFLALAVSIPLLLLTR